MIIRITRGAFRWKQKESGTRREDLFAGLGEGKGAG